MATKKKKTNVSNNKKKKDKSLDRLRNLSEPPKQDITKDDKQRRNLLSTVSNDNKLQQQINWYFDQILERKDSDRRERYCELKNMVSNDAMASLTVTTIADEAVQLGMAENVVTISSSSKTFAKYYQNKIKYWGIDKYLRSWAKDLAQYGDFITVLDVDTKDKNNEGVREVFPRGVNSLHKRLEFTIAEARDSMKSDYQNMNLDKILASIKEIEKTMSNIAKYYKPFLLGFHVDDFILPPWGALHGRIYETDPEYNPYGKSLIDGARVPYRLIATTKMLITLARLNNFPTELFLIETSDKSNEVEKWNIISEAKEELMLQVNARGVSQAETPSVNNRMFLPKDLVEFDIKDSQIDIDQIADYEAFLNEYIMGLQLPKGYLLIDESDYDDANALLYQDVKFARLVYIVQSALLEQIVRLIEIDMASSGSYEVGSVDFTASMPYPVPKMSEDRISLTSDALDLMNDAIDFLKDRLNVEEIPEPILYDMMVNFTGWEKDKIDNWFKYIKKQKKGEEESPELNQGSNATGDETDQEESLKRKKIIEESKVIAFNMKVEKKDLSGIMENVVHNVYANRGYAEYLLKGRHHVSSLVNEGNYTLTDKQKNIMETYAKEQVKVKLKNKRQSKIKKRNNFTEREMGV